jgi:hypothetical protein
MATGLGRGDMGFEEHKKPSVGREKGQEVKPIVVVRSLGTLCMVPKNWDFVCKQRRVWRVSNEADPGGKKLRHCHCNRRKEMRS